MDLCKHCVCDLAFDLPDRCDKCDICVENRADTLLLGAWKTTKLQDIVQLFELSFDQFPEVNLFPCIGLCIAGDMQHSVLFHRGAANVLPGQVSVVLQSTEQELVIWQGRQP